jgi:hypothetical protein
MGLVKFNKTTLNVENVPDGHEIISESELIQLRQTRDALSLLKSKIPVGVDESKLGEIIEQGQRYPTIAQELATHKTSVADLTGKLSKFQNIPAEFDVVKWNSYVNKEKEEQWTVKFNETKKLAFDKIEQEFKVRPVIDDRFVPMDKVKALNLEDKKAVDSLVDIYNDAHTAQQEFVKSITGGNIQSPHAVGGGEVRPAGAPQAGKVGDLVGEEGSALRHF